MKFRSVEGEVRIPIENTSLRGRLGLPRGVAGLIVIAHHLHAPKKMETLPMVSNLFEESDALEMAARLIHDWFQIHLLPTAVQGG